MHPTRLVLLFLALALATSIGTGALPLVAAIAGTAAALVVHVAWWRVEGHRDSQLRQLAGPEAKVLDSPELGWAVLLATAATLLLFVPTLLETVQGRWQWFDPGSVPESAIGWVGQIVFFVPGVSDALVSRTLGLPHLLAIGKEGGFLLLGVGLLADFFAFNPLLQLITLRRVKKQVERSLDYTHRPAVGLGRRAIGMLEEALASPDGERRSNAVVAICELACQSEDHPDIARSLQAALCRALGDERPETRVEALKGLRLLKAVDPQKIGEALADADLRVRIYAAHAAAAHRLPGTAHTIAKILVEAAATEDLGDIGQLVCDVRDLKGRLDDQPSLATLARNPVVDVARRRLLLQALVDHATATPDDHELWRYREEGDAVLRQIALRGLIARRGPNRLEYLHQLTYDDDPDIAVGAWQALERDLDEVGRDKWAVRGLNAKTPKIRAVAARHYAARGADALGDLRARFQQERDVDARAGLAQALLAAYGVALVRAAGDDARSRELMIELLHQRLHAEPSVGADVITLLAKHAAMASPALSRFIVDSLSQLDHPEVAFALQTLTERRALSGTPDGRRPA